MTRVIAYGQDARFTTLLDRMRRDVAAQRERARERGFLEISSLLSPDRREKEQGVRRR